ncbi:MAG: hypothetical protein LBL04_16130 [Bacteroidales bacterium]|nr:hypothetical protein [Bacteroidales bacterium]
MKSLYYTSVSKMADILRDNFRRSDLWNFLDVKYEPDDHISVVEVCEIYHVNLEIFLHVCNLYTFDDYLLEENIPDGFPVDPAIDYITKAHDFFIKNTVPQLRQEYMEIAPMLNRYTTALFDAFMEAVIEHMSCISDIFVKYGQTPDSITSDQIEYVIEQELEINRRMDALIQQLSEFQEPKDFMRQINHLKYHLMFLRKDSDKHNTMKNLTLKLLRK